MEKILIDGYNLLYKDGALKNLAERSLEEARGELLSSLAAYRTEGMTITVVFDGRGNERRAGKASSPGVEVRFSTYPRTADDLILEILEGEPRRAGLTVVTSDKKDIGRVARAEGIRWISSEAFLRRLRRNRPEKGGDAEKPISASPKELDYWLKRFRSPESEEKK